MSADFTESKLGSKRVYAGKLLTVHEDQVRLHDGSTAQREYIVHPGAALILPLFDDNTVLMEWQYRYPVQAHCLELPAGKLDSGEPPLEAAKRELLEETGYAAEEWTQLCTMLPGIGYSTERIEFFLARKLTFKCASPDEGEFLETLRMPMAEALERVRDGTIRDSKTMLGLLWADRFANIAGQTTNL